MKDYNGDGKIDKVDECIFHNIIENPTNRSAGGDYNGDFDWSILILFVIMEIFRPGRIFSGWFSALIWLICLAILFLKFACWLQTK